MLLLLGVAAAVLTVSRDAACFTTFPDYHLCLPGPIWCEWSPDYQVDIEATLEQAARWDASPDAPDGLADGISVAVISGFAEAFGAQTPAEVEAIRERVRSAFRTWETPELFFEIEFDRSPNLGSEIALEAVGGDHWIFNGTTYMGMTVPYEWFDSERMLTNGDVVPGYAFDSVDIWMNRDAFAVLLGLLSDGGLVPPDGDLLMLERLVAHEIGHANQYLYANFDSDLDPMTPVEVDPDHPFAGLIVSPNVDNDAMMWGGVPEHPEWFFMTELRPDDLAGLEVLYPSPVPEPSFSLMLLSVGLALSVLARRRRG
jgi:hypothetical protein